MSELPEAVIARIPSTSISYLIRRGRNTGSGHLLSHAHIMETMTLALASGITYYLWLWCNNKHTTYFSWSMGVLCVNSGHAPPQCLNRDRVNASIHQKLRRINSRGSECHYRSPLSRRITHSTSSWCCVRFSRAVTNSVLDERVARTNTNLSAVSHAMWYAERGQLADETLK